MEFGLVLMSQLRQQMVALFLVIACLDGACWRLAQGNRFFGNGLPSSHNRVGTVAAEACGVSYAGDCEFWLVKELRRSCGSRVRFSFCSQQSKVEALRFVGADKDCRDFRVGVSGHLCAEKIGSAGKRGNNVLPFLISANSLSLS